MSDLYGVPRRRIIGEGFFWIVVVIGLILALTVGGLAWRYVIAAPKGKVEAREQIQSGPFRIAAYDRFFNLCAAVQSDEATIAALQAELKTKPPASRVTQINASITGLRSGRAEKINQYNADARKDYTIGQFRASGLPYQLFIEREATECVVG